MCSVVLFQIYFHIQGTIDPSSAREDSSSDDESDDDQPPTRGPPYPMENNNSSDFSRLPEVSEDEGLLDSEADELPEIHPSLTGTSIPRPMSGVSRYRTPMGMSMSAGIPASYTPPVGGFQTALPPHQSIQAQLRQQQSPQPHFPLAAVGPGQTHQPLPRYATPSAFDSTPATDTRNLSSASPSLPSSFPTTNLSYPPHLAHSNHALQPYSFRPPPPNQPIHSLISTDDRSHAAHTTAGTTERVLPPALPLERAVESLQATLAALRERLELLESHTFGSSTSLPGVRRLAGDSEFVNPSGGAGSANNAPNGSILRWEPSRMGLWSTILVPATHIVNQIRYVLLFILTHPSTSSSLTSGGQSGRGRRRGSGDGSFNVRAIIRRLILDSSFVVVLFLALKTAWRASGIRRREVLRALRMVWLALAGGKPKRTLVDKGVGTL